MAAKPLTDLGANFHVFSEQALILQGNLSDFDSAIQLYFRLAKTRLSLMLPRGSQLIDRRADLFQGIPPGHEYPLRLRLIFQSR